MLVSYSVLPLTQMLYLYPFRVSPAVRIEFPQAVALNLQPCFFLFFYLFPFRASSDEIDGQKTGKNGYHAGSPEAAHPATGPAASGAGGSQDPSTSHTR